jgi:hypothetical protein
MNTEPKEIKAAAPSLPRAFELAATCPQDGLPIIHLQGSSVCACANGHLYDYKTMESLS